MKKKVPIGISDFKMLVEEKYSYVDKTLLIEEIWESAAVVLITRPRRFGKTLNMSMMQYFFEKTEPSHSHLFEELAIQQHPELMSEQGQWPVIFLSFRKIKKDSWEGSYEEIKNLIKDEFLRHDFLLKSTKIKDLKKAEFERLMSGKGSDTELGNSLQLLTELLHQHFGKTAIVLIDEYDAPLNTAYTKGYYDKMIEFMKHLLHGALKDNSSLKMGVLTGVMRIAKESIFSDLNNLIVQSMAYDDLNDKFGFTQPEVDSLLENFELSEKKSDVGKWYNGYKIGKSNPVNIYNPWSIINLLKRNGEIEPYWVNVGSNELIKLLIAKSNREIKGKFDELFNGKEIIEMIDEGIIFKGMEQSAIATWSVLFFGGYVTPNRISGPPGNKKFHLKIPNMEIEILLEKMVKDIFSRSFSSQHLDAFFNALKFGDEVETTRLLQEFVLSCISMYDFNADDPENSYHLFVLGLLVIKRDEYEIKSNRESGYGKYDISLAPHDTTQTGIIIEFKKVNSTNKNIEHAADIALEQIQKREYAQEMRARGIKEIYAYGMAFEKKNVCVKGEKLG